MRPNYDLSEIEETRGEDRTKETNENGDNTLMKYFFPEDIEGSKVVSINHAKDNKEKKNIPCEGRPEKVEKMFRKPLKLRNALKQCYWDRQPITCSVQVLLLILRMYLDSTLSLLKI